MNSTNGHQPRAAQSGDAAAQKCFVCGDRTEERCFCKIHRQGGGPVMLCCPSCTIQYVDSRRTPADSREQELRAYEKSLHFWIGEEKPLA